MLEIEPKKVISKSLERNSNKKLNRKWGSAIVTSQQAKRAQAKKVEKKQDNMGFLVELGAPQKLEPLDPKY